MKIEDVEPQNFFRCDGEKFYKNSKGEITWWNNNNKKLRDVSECPKKINFRGGVSIVAMG